MFDGRRTTADAANGEGTVTPWCGVLSTAALVIISGLAATGHLWRRRRVEHDPATAVDQIARDCEAVGSDAFEIVLAGAREDDIGSRWGRLHPALVELEHRITETANTTPDSRGRRSLDRTAAALTACRAALEAYVQLQVEPATSPLLEAGDDVVMVRCEDLVLSARALNEPPRTRYPRSLSRRRDQATR